MHLTQAVKRSERREDEEFGLLEIERVRKTISFPLESGEQCEVY